MFANKSSMFKRALFVFAHMDDETVSSYGTIRRMLDEGVEVVVACMCGYGRSEGFSEKRREVFTSYSGLEAIVEIGENYDLGLTRTAAQSVFDALVDKYEPNVVITHWSHDLHFEHRLVSEVALVACRNAPGKPVKQLWYTSSPVERWTHGMLGQVFVPSFFVEVGKYEQ